MKRKSHEFQIKQQTGVKTKNKTQYSCFFLEIDIFSIVISIHIGKGTFLESTLAPNMAIRVVELSNEGLQN